MTNIFFIFFLIIVFVFCPFSSVEAYVDPGSGSFLLQLLLATVLGTLYSLKLCWAKGSGFF
jgi:hypothetical protein